MALRAGIAPVAVECPGCNSYATGAFSSVPGPCPVGCSELCRLPVSITLDGPVMVNSAPPRLRFEIIHGGGGSASQICLLVSSQSSHACRSMQRVWLDFWKTMRGPQVSAKRGRDAVEEETAVPEVTAGPKRRKSGVKSALPTADTGRAACCTHQLTPTATPYGLISGPACLCAGSLPPSLHLAGCLQHLHCSTSALMYTASCCSCAGS